MTKHSRQRDAVYAELCNRKDHPTAEEIYLKLKNEIPSLSIATVYRNLSLLAEEGKILRLTFGNKDRFDGDTSDHSHFFCNNCGKVIDLMVESDSSEKITGFDGTIFSKATIYTGLCPKCKNSIN